MYRMTNASINNGRLTAIFVPVLRTYQSETTYDIDVPITNRESVHIYNKVTLSTVLWDVNPSYVDEFTLSGYHLSQVVNITHIGYGALGVAYSCGNFEIFAISLLNEHDTLQIGDFRAVKKSTSYTGINSIGTKNVSSLTLISEEEKNYKNEQLKKCAEDNHKSENWFSWIFSELGVDGDHR